MYITMHAVCEGMPLVGRRGEGEGVGGMEGSPPLPEKLVCHYPYPLQCFAQRILIL